MTDREPVNIMGVIAFPEPDKSKRRIRFIDPEYNTLFYIPDGASIVMTRMDGSSVIRPCTYIDDYVDAVGFQKVPNFLKELQKLKERGEAR